MRARRSIAALLLAAALCAGRAGAFELSLLTYNVHGLPSWVARDDPPARIPQILDKARAYDVVLLQEDFAHHALVVAHNPLRFLLRGNGAPSALFQGAGLTILSQLEAIASERASYGVCSGWLGAANDCLARKGWMHARLRLPEGGELDVWNTHLDAGRGDTDRDARRVQLGRLAAAIERHSAGRAVVAGGDLNLEWSDPADRALLDAFAQRLGLATAVRTQPAEWDDQVDYLLARSGDALCLAPLAGGKDERLLDAAGRALSDHPGLYARMRATRCDAPLAAPSAALPPSARKETP
ncbi:MAG: hypothetical protein DCC71_22165 [Proteobacteria bacterium]|nr:MAG: hypothetical protein DCC71_22165 [Pseudomonadota bacterium]